MHEYPEHEDVCEHLSNTMNDVSDVMWLLSQKGVRLWTEHGQIHFRAYRGALSSDEICTLRARRVDLLEFLEGVELETKISIPSRPVGSKIPLGGLQRTSWKYYVEVGHATRYPRSVLIGLRVFGKLDSYILQRSIAMVMERHEPLRTTIIESDGIAIQQIAEADGYHLRVTKINEKNPIRRAQKLQSLITDFVEEEVELSIGPLFVAKLFQVSPEEHVFVLSLNHMITDEITNEIIVAEVMTAYYDSVLRRPSSLPPITLQFADYVLWQQTMNSTWLQTHGNYWKKRLIGAPAIRLPFDNAVRAESRAPTASVGLFFDKKLTGQIRKLSRGQQMLPALLIFAVYVATVSRWCDQRDLVVTFVETGRFRPELTKMVGWLTNHLRLRMQMEDRDTFTDLLQKVKREFYCAVVRQNFNQAQLLIPGCEEDMVNRLYFNWLSRMRPLGSVRERNGGHDIVLKRFPIQRKEKPAFTFGAFFMDSGEEIFAEIVYRADLFLRSSVEDFTKKLRVMAEEVVR